jgi:glyoxylase-like metal-dependent hydrolase (beta-lactamase superfamily II)
VLEAFETAGISPDSIEKVIYTHLHNDHAGNAHLFPNALHIFQDLEWKELLDPLPSMMIRGDYDQSLIPVLKDMNCQRVAGEVEILDGIKLIQTPGHTRGSQSVMVSTGAGTYFLPGDTVPALPIAFPQMNKWTQMDGTVLSITPAPKHWGPAVPSGIVYDHYAWFQSIYRIHASLRAPEFLIPGHEPSMVGKTFG